MSGLPWAGHRRDYGQKQKGLQGAEVTSGVERCHAMWAESVAPTWPDADVESKVMLPWSQK